MIEARHLTNAIYQNPSVFEKIRRHESGEKAGALRASARRDFC
jgi:hypothetical protein